MKTCIKLLSQIISALLIAVLLITNFCVPIYAENIIEAEQDGVISDKLLEMMEDNPDDVYRVIIWLEDIDTETAVNNALSKIPNYEEEMARLSKSSIKSEDDVRKWDCYISTKRNAMKNCYLRITSGFCNALLLDSEIIFYSSYLPTVIAEWSGDRINWIAKQSCVKSIDYYCDPDIVNENDNTMEISPLSTKPGYYSTYENFVYINADVIEETWGTKGYGINVGILDGGNPEQDYIGVYGADITLHYPQANEVHHTSRVLEIAYKTAPEASFYCTTYYGISNATLLSEIEWFVDNNVDVINMSLDVRDGEGGAIDTNNEYGTIAKALDRYVKQYGVTIIVTSGNEGEEGVESGGMAYNVITVGNYHILGNDIVSSSYNNDSNTAYAYKPDFCAPGYFRFADFSTDSGTSYAAPLTTGVVALLMAARASLRLYPTQVKAILTASVSLNTYHDTPGNNSDYRKYGAGVIDAGRASNLIGEGNIETNEITVSQNSPYHEYQIELFSDQLTRISLAFEKNINLSKEYCLANLNLEIYNSSGVKLEQSITTNNNVEIIEFTPTVYDTYTIRVAMVNPAQSGTSITATRYSLAWIQE